MATSTLKSSLFMFSACDNQSNNQSEPACKIQKSIQKIRNASQSLETNLNPSLKNTIPSTTREYTLKNFDEDLKSATFESYAVNKSVQVLKSNNINRKLEFTNALAKHASQKHYSTHANSNEFGEVLKSNRISDDFRNKITFLTKLTSSPKKANS